MSDVELQRAVEAGDVDALAREVRRQGHILAHDSPGGVLILMRQVDELKAQRDALLDACKEMFADLNGEYGVGVLNGYWPMMRPKLERWSAVIAQVQGE